MWFSKERQAVRGKSRRQYADRMTEGKAARIRAERIEGRRLSAKEIREAEKAKDARWTIDRLLGLPTGKVWKQTRQITQGSGG